MALNTPFKRHEEWISSNGELIGAETRVSLLPEIKMDLTKYEDDLKNTVDGWDEEYRASVYLHLYRRGMRVDQAEGIVDRMRRRKD